MVSGGEINVKSGKLTARLPDKDDRLVVNMPGLKLTDLGTGFGVEVGTSGESLVTVFEGKVRLDEEESDSKSVVLNKGRFVLHSSDAGSHITNLKFDPVPFRDLWPLTLGIEDVSDLVNFAIPGPMNRDVYGFQDENHVFLLPEEQGVTLSEPLLADISETDFSWPNSGEVSSIPAGKRLSSYLVMYNPPKGKGGRKVPIRSLVGSITFNREIVGVICTEHTLEQSTEVLGNSSWKLEWLPESRLENLDANLGKLPHDSLNLSRDRRSIHFDLSARQGIDSMRILLSDP